MSTDPTRPNHGQAPHAADQEPDRTDRAQTRRDLVLTGVLTIIVVIYGWETFKLPDSSPNQADVGPQAYPQLVLLAMVVLTIAIGTMSVLRARSAGRSRTGKVHTEQGQCEERARHDWRPLLRLTTTVVVTLVYLQLMVWVGFVVSTALFLAVESWLVLGDRRWRGARLLIPLAFGIVSSVAIWALFDLALGVLLPDGLVFSA